jgi:hypothetical protein
MRYLPPPLYVPPHPAGKPVMAEKQVIMKVIVPAIIFQITGEFRQKTVYSQLMYFFRLPRFKVNESRPFSQFDDDRVIGVVDTGIDIYRMTLPAQFPCEFSYINAHAAGIHSSKVADRATMSAEHSDFQFILYHGILSTLPSIL